MTVYNTQLYYKCQKKLPNRLSSTSRKFRSWSGVKSTPIASRILHRPKVQLRCCANSNNKNWMQANTLQNKAALLNTFPEIADQARWTRCSKCTRSQSSKVGFCINRHPKAFIKKSLTSELRGWGSSYWLKGSNNRKRMKILHKHSRSSTEAKTGYYPLRKSIGNVSEARFWGTQKQSGWRLNRKSKRFSTGSSK